MEKLHGMTQIYTGNGKDKTTAAFGLAVQAAGRGQKVVIIQFMKMGRWYGEIEGFRHIPNVEIYSYGGGKFRKKGDASDEEHLAYARAAMDKAYETMGDDSVDILILDELNNAVYFELVTEDEALALMAARPEHQELIITGRNATERMIDAADLVTEMREIKHPYQKGIQARQGIEY